MKPAATLTVNIASGDIVRLQNILDYIIFVLQCKLLLTQISFFVAEAHTAILRRYSERAAYMRGYAGFLRRLIRRGS